MAINSITTPGSMAVEREVVGGALLEGRADVNARDEYENTPLHEALIEHHEETAIALIKEGADVNAKNQQHTTPLQIAAFENLKEAVIFLVNRGANIGFKNKFGNNSIDWAHMSAAGCVEIEPCLRKISNLLETGEWRPKKALMYPAPIRAAMRTLVVLAKAPCTEN